MKYLTDPQTGDAITCEDCQYVPATHETVLVDPVREEWSDLCDSCYSRNDLAEFRRLNASPLRDSDYSSWIVTWNAFRDRIEQERGEDGWDALADRFDRTYCQQEEG